MKTAIFIDNIALDDCLLLVEYQFPHKDMEMKLSINSIHGKLKNISNIKIYTDTPMTLNMRSKLMKKVNF